jgi:lipoprotein-anchoring transpeptidase ErfK/SrfK
MQRSGYLKTGLAMVAVVGMMSAITPQKAAAQGIFSSIFGGGGGWQSGRQEVSFPKRYGTRVIVISLADRRLYYVHKKGAALSYPIGVPTGRAMWTGVERVSRKKVNPGWTPTADMRRENPKLPGHVKGGDPRNPLGVRAMYLGNTLYRIHGTDAPWTVGTQVSHGCIRLYNNDVIDLYNRTRIGTKVIVTNRRVAG